MSASYAEIAARPSPFGEFVHEQHALAKSRGDVAQQRKSEWEKALNTLYKKVEGYLLPYISAGQISISQSDIQLHEEFIGKYTMPQMSIWLGKTEVKLEPVGTYIFAAAGRVDMLVPGRQAALMFVPKSCKNIYEVRSPDIIAGDVNVWKILEHRVNYVTLNKKTFQAALMDIING